MNTATQILADKELRSWINELPYWATWQDALCTVDGYLIRGVKVSGVDIHCRGDSEIEAVTRHFSHWLDSLDEGIHVQLFCEFGNFYERDGIFEKFLSNFKERSATARFLARSKIQHLMNQKQLMAPHNYLFFSIPILDARQRFWQRLGFAVHDLEKAHEQAYGKLERAVKMARETLAALNIVIEPMTATHVADLAYRLINPERSSQLPMPKLSQPSSEADGAKRPASPATLREELAFSFPITEGNCVYLDGAWMRALSLKSLPDGTFPASILPLLQAPSQSGRADGSIQYLLSYGLTVIPQRQELTRLKFIGNVRQVLASFSHKPSNIETQVASSDMQTCIKHVVETDQRIYALSLNLILKATSREALDQSTDQALLWFRQVNQMEARVEQYTQREFFVNSLPGNTHNDFRSVRVTTENAADLLPLYQPWRGTQRAVTLLMNHLNGVIKFDPFDESLQAYNAILCGSTGSGKSFTACYLLQSFLPLAQSTLIIDLGGSYRKLCRLFGGQYIEVGKGLSLNPLFTADEMNVSDGSAHEIKLYFLTSLFERMIIEKNRQETGLLNMEKSLLRQAITLTYEKHQGKRPMLQDVVNTLEQMAKTLPESDKAGMSGSLGKRLKLWCEGPYGAWFNQPDGLNLASPFIVLDMKGIDGELREVVLLTLVGHAWGKIMSESGQKLVVLDEVWSLLQDPATSSFVAELYRTARKYHCGILSISQSPADFANSSVGPAVLANSIVRYILRLKDGWDCLSEAFKLTERELSLVQRLRMEKGSYSELYLAFGDQRAVVKVQPSPLEYWICTTHPKDLVIQQNLRKKYPQLAELNLMRLLAKLYPKGGWQNDA